MEVDGRILVRPCLRVAVDMLLYEASNFVRGDAPELLSAPLVTRPVVPVGEGRHQHLYLWMVDLLLAWFAAAAAGRATTGTGGRGGARHGILEVLRQLYSARLAQKVALGIKYFLSVVFSTVPPVGSRKFQNSFLLDKSLTKNRLLWDRS